MKKILVTGASGGLGNAIVKALLVRIPSNRIVATVRDVSKAADLAEQGVDIRRADYLDYDSLRSSFEGVDTVFLVSAVSFTDRTPQHANAIRAARESGVRRIFYTAIERNGVDGVSIPTVTESDIETEQLLRDSGLAYTVVKHPLYIETMPVFLGSKVFQTGVRTPAGMGRIPLTSRDDLAEGAAELLARDSDAPQEISLNSGEAYSFPEVAQALSKLQEKPIAFGEVSETTYIEERVADGIPLPVAEFFTAWFVAVRKGAFEAPSPALAQLIGRVPVDLHVGLAKAFQLENV